MRGLRLTQLFKYSKRTFDNYHSYDNEGMDELGRYKDDGYEFGAYKNREDYLEWKKWVMGIYRKTRVFRSDSRNTADGKKETLIKQEIIAEIRFKEQILEIAA